MKTKKIGNDNYQTLQLRITALEAQLKEFPESPSLLKELAELGTQLLRKGGFNHNGSNAPSRSIYATARAF